MEAADDIQAAADSGNKKVLISIDGSPQSEKALHFYMDNLHHEGNEVTILHVVELPDVADMAHLRQMYLTPHSLVDLWKEESSKAKELELKFKHILKERGVEQVKCQIEGGLKPGQVIVHVAQESGASMIVVGTRGLGSVRRTLLGSVSDYVLHHAHCPVVVCRE